MRAGVQAARARHPGGGRRLRQVSGHLLCGRPGPLEQVSPGLTLLGSLLLMRSWDTEHSVAGPILLCGGSALSAACLGVQRMVPLRRGSGSPAEGNWLPDSCLEGGHLPKSFLGVPALLGPALTWFWVGAGLRRRWRLQRRRVQLPRGARRCLCCSGTPPKCFPKRAMP